MNIKKVEMFQGHKVEVVEMVLECADNKLNLFWKIYMDDAIFNITFFNVSRFRIEEISAPFEIHGFEVISHTQNGWESDSAYEIRDFEDNLISFFCECFTLDE